MCGITGFFSYKNKIDPKIYYKAHKKIAHRGPDDEGFIYKNNKEKIKHLAGDDTINELNNENIIYDQKPSTLILGHRRLSIIDLSPQGHQPFSFKGLHLVFNGEIYNYIELRDKLKKLGYIFKTDSDTEVFLKAYHYWGVEAFNRFNGMWASAIYDEEKDILVLTRDRFGIKPLYYSLIDDSLVFGSEIKFVSSFMDNLYPNEQMIYEYLRFNRTDHTDQTFFKDILQLEPSHYIEYTKQGVKKNQYWIMLEEKDVTEKTIEKKLKDSISLRMQADVEVGSLLSGGIDSSTILGIINQEKHTERFQTFSAVFKEEEFSEKKYIDEFNADNIELEKHFIYPKAEELSNVIDDLLHTQEEPFRSLAVFSQYEIYKYVKKNTDVTVLLNGQGADEIFTGYTEYYYVYLLELLREFRLNLFVKEFYFLSKNREVSKNYLAKELVINFLGRYIRKSDKYLIFNKKFIKEKTNKKFNSLLKNSLWSSLTFSALREYLRYEDKNSMRFSLESRLPFLDYRLVQSAFSLNNKSKIKNGLSKIVLRKIAKGKIPNETLNRKDKMGFVSPQEEWQKNILKNELDKTYKDIKINGLFNFIESEKVYAFYKDYQCNKFNDWGLIWRVYMVYKWKNVWDIVDNTDD